MKNKYKKITKSAAVLALGIVLMGGAFAYADTASHSFSDTIPALQQSHYLNSYQRTTSSVASKITFTSISDSQLMNVKAQNLQNDSQYFELKGISATKTVSITNNTPAGQFSRLIITNHDWNFLSPTVTGSFTIN